MRIGSLFAGIGGLELGLEWAGLGRTIWQVERDAWRREQLARHWPDARRFDDVCTVSSSNLPPVDLICGGFPCQDVSSAGARAGLAGSRSGLWFEYLRIVGELRPEWVVVENVASGARAWVDVVVSGLELAGYAAFPFPVAAADCGAPHLRERVFVICRDANSNRESVVREHGKMAELPSARFAVPDWAEPPSVSMADGVSRGMVALGNAVVPQCAEVVGWIIRELRGDI